MKWAIDRRGIRLILEISGGKENPQLAFYGNNGKKIIEVCKFYDKVRMTSHINHFRDDEIEMYMQCVVLSSIICKEWKDFLENPKEFIMKEWWVFKEEIKS